MVELYNGDCLEIMKNIPDNSVDAIITDPPFAFAGGISNGRSSIADSQFFLHWWKEVAFHLTRILKPEATGFIWCDWKTASIIAEGFRVKHQTYNQIRVAQMLYHYREMPGQGRPFRNSVDMIAYIRAGKGDANRIPNTTHNMISKYWYYGKHKYHPAEKDVELIEILIDWCSDENQSIIDPFMGSGSVGVACLNKNRRFIGIEIDKDYFKIAEKRIRAYREQTELVFTE